MQIKNPKDKLLTLAILAGALVLYVLLKIPCPTWYFLHIPCPCCGMTRAWLRLLQLDFSGAFRMHGMFWSVPYLLLHYLFDGKLLPGKYTDKILLAMIGLGFAVNWILRLINADCMIPL
ncbi:MAG: DUF2752 domain-containing protein [Oscillospiraceae bacterium]|nr:DUF2752 domain-containing protein [Oscillospiraceae bacterium]